jgi:hypothetical protein
LVGVTRSRSLLAAVGVSLIVGGCGGSAVHGKISGTLEFVEPVSGHLHPVAGHVTLSGPTQRTILVGTDGKFSLTVTGGSYRISATMLSKPPIHCRVKHAVDVTKSSARHVRVICNSLQG